MFQIEAISPVNCIRFVDEPEIPINDGEDEGSSTKKQSCMKIVEFVMKVVHLVSVVFGVGVVRGVHDEPFTGLEHCSQEIHILFEWQFEVLSVNDCSFFELLVSCQPTKCV